MEINMEKTVYDVKLKQDALWGLAVSIFWLAAAVFLYALGAVLIWLFGNAIGGLVSMLCWFMGTVFGLIGLVKGIRLVWQSWD